MGKEGLLGRRDLFGIGALAGAGAVVAIEQVGNTPVNELLKLASKIGSGTDSIGKDTTTSTPGQISIAEFNKALSEQKAGYETTIREQAAKVAELGQANGRLEGAAVPQATQIAELKVDKSKLEAQVAKLTESEKTSAEYKGAAGPIATQTADSKATIANLQAQVEADKKALAEQITADKQVLDEQKAKVADLTTQLTIQTNTADRLKEENLRQFLENQKLKADAAKPDNEPPTRIALLNSELEAEHKALLNAKAEKDTAIEQVKDLQAQLTTALTDKARAEGQLEIYRQAYKDAMDELKTRMTPAEYHGFEVSMGPQGFVLRMGPPK